MTFLHRPEKLAKSRANEKLQFRLADFLEEDSNFDLILVLDVIEHLEDYFRFLRRLTARSHYKIFQQFGLVTFRCRPSSARRHC